MRPASRGNWYVAAAWLILLGGYIIVCELVPAGAARTATANIILCLMPLLVNGALLINAVTPDWRKKAFWMLLALGCSLSMVGQRSGPTSRSTSAGMSDIFTETLFLPARRPDDSAARFHRTALESYGMRLRLCGFRLSSARRCIVRFRRNSLAIRRKGRQKFCPRFQSSFTLRKYPFHRRAALLSQKATGRWHGLTRTLPRPVPIYAVRYLAIELLVGRNSY